MRLRGYVAIELLVGALMVSAGGGALTWGAHELRSSFAREASASVRPPGARRAAVAEPASLWDLRIDVRPGIKPWVGLFLGQADDVLLAPLAEASVQSVKLNRGGTSLSLRVELANGARAAVKPAQIHLHSQPRREIAAYRINRLLGLSSVPPAMGRRFRVSDMVDALPPEHLTGRERLLTEMSPDDDGTVVAELSWWIPVLKTPRIDGFEIDSTDGVVTWMRYLTAGAPVPHREIRTIAQLSDMLLFDYLINNSDRWSGGNVKASEDGRVLFFMDNTMAFGDSPRGHSKVRTYLERSQKFSRRLVARLRHLRESEVREVVSREVAPFVVLLTDEEIAALMARRDRLLEYVDRMIEMHGPEAVLVFP